MRATWNGKTIASSDETVVVDGNHYFPADSIVSEHFESSAKQSVCGWKGTANYAHIVVDGSKNEDAAWCYPTPKDAAKAISGHYAFWKGVEVSG